MTSAELQQYFRFLHREASFSALRARDRCRPRQAPDFGRAPHPQSYTRAAPPLHKCPTPIYPDPLKSIFQLFVHAIDAVCGWLGFTLMYRLHKHRVISDGINQSNLHQVLTPSLLIANFLLTSALSYLSATVLHCYGYGRYVQALQGQRKDTKIGEFLLTLPSCVAPWGPGRRLMLQEGV